MTTFQYNNAGLLLPGQVIAGRLTIQSLAGRGGMGAVYTAWDSTLCTTVALKQLLVNSHNRQVGDDLSARLFEREAEMLATIHHPAIPRLLGRYHEQGALVISMEYIHGERLDRLLARADLSFAARRHVAQQLCHIVAYLHSLPRPILHRDIEPAHLIIRKRQVLLIDFGLAGFLDDHALDGVIMGKAGYSPPEQCVGAALDCRADQYALGQTLRQVFGDYARAPALERVIERATDPLPARRYPSVTAMLSALNQACVVLEATTRPVVSVPRPADAAQPVPAGSTAPAPPASSTLTRQRDSGRNSQRRGWMIVLLTVLVLCVLALVSICSQGVKPLRLPAPEAGYVMPERSEIDIPNIARKPENRVVGFFQFKSCRRIEAADPLPRFMAGINECKQYAKARE